MWTSGLVDTDLRKEAPKARQLSGFRGGKLRGNDKGVRPVYLRIGEFEEPVADSLGLSFAAPAEAIAA